jgi:hypothetical protein
MQLQWHVTEMFFLATSRKAIEEKKLKKILKNVSKERWRRVAIR